MILGYQDWLGKIYKTHLMESWANICGILVLDMFLYTIHVEGVVKLEKK